MTKYSKLVLLFSVGFMILAASCHNNPDKKKNVHDPYIKHGIVFYQEGRYAGWPANHGIWSWDNEILVGFVEAAFREAKGLHPYDPKTARNKYARSKDGGQTWLIEDAFDHGQTAKGQDNAIDDEYAVVPTPMSEPVGDFSNPNFILTFLRHNNHNGPSHFYYSNNKGVNWKGPFIFPDIDKNGVATRTDYSIDGEKELSAFITVAKPNGKEGRVALVRTTDGGINWHIVSWIGAESDGFDIMPSSLRLSTTELLTVIRTRTKDKQDLLTSYLTKDNGKTWEKLKDPVADTGKGGSPPTLVKLNDGRLALAYIYRSETGSRVNIRFSSDNGRNWGDEIVLRSGDGATRDVGYPRMVQRPDGKIVIIYYWNNANQEGAKPYRYIASTIVDPNDWGQ
ncbi:sialidase family protein [Gaoshiqia sediminis]|uniref:Glycoside hydrolase n=1 Tax=Gaoshiqia sediminis TaxID=2986998 RepID=A0AA41YB58_9BACT|nr:sialidase family protein [Gaoshiqia sediminis]MCW0482725.1 glycoside hydrolase [Gaoshiqia sediminis]